jgi:hypothetical protein
MRRCHDDRTDSGLFPPLFLQCHIETWFCDFILILLPKILPYFISSTRNNITVRYNQLYNSDSNAAIKDYWKKRDFLKLFRISKSRFKIRANVWKASLRFFIHCFCCSVNILVYLAWNERTNEWWKRNYVSLRVRGLFVDTTSSFVL